ncbi:MAG: 2-hydroxyacyl-CoA dehydratase [Candidatus Marinimicrobia bacterium]|nr:2-hydroxyacyl-CoA dehydratase [Candidatus Neomarinimicrobiota bacterium]
MTTSDTRRDYLQNQKSSGRKLLGVFPAQFPRELLWAFNILPVEIWDPPVEIAQANAHLQPYICSIVRGGLELILQGKSSLVDGYLFPHTCDSLQNLASIVNDHLDTGKPCFFFYHPKAVDGQPAREFYRNQLTQLIDRLEQHFGSINIERLQECIQTSRRLYSQLNELFNLRKQGLLQITNSDFYATLRRSEFLWPTDYISELELLLTQKCVKPLPSRAVVLSGILPNPPEILSLLDQHKIRIAADDLLNGQRRMTFLPTNANDPLEAITDAYFAQPPCSTKDSAIAERLKHLQKLTVDSKSKGVIFNIIKFCEPELFDLPQLRAGLRSTGIPSLVIETEINQVLSGQIVTRLEAFLEMIGD